MDPVEFESDGAVGIVRLNRPEQMNSMNDALLDGLIDTLERAVSSDSLAALVLTGNGRAFCAGGDLSSMTMDLETVPQETSVSQLRRHARASELLRETSLVTIAAVNGACAGAGLGLAAAADIRIAAQSAVFRVAFLGAAMSGDFGTIWSLVSLLGEAKARELCLLDEKISAEDAQRIGFVSRVVAPESTVPEALSLAQRIASSAPLARSGIKRNLNEAGRLPLAEAMRRESERHVACAHSADAAEAGRAFLDRRTPVFQGR